MKKTYRRMLASMLVVGLAFGAGSIAATETEQDPVKARHEAMEQIKDALMSVAAMAKKQAPFDAAVVAEKAGIIADKLEASMKLFPEGSEGGKAKPEVWSQREGFDKGMKASHEAAVALKAVTEEAALMPALGALGQTCQGCHETYRMPDQ